ncbi:MAG TPA: DUF378 domain-containing protein [Candidatus Paceibacterota bacterium]|jgi:hypothetical protein|nr:DUF378 domain-containing protein [Parcubacteria group bacterium]MDP6119491.1 DUF378 domain-containing protein [Candidatus Paceibacterota bacterium]HJN62637.1 DUF378 domain-containing protein [Candidatus Paceibacterota bacterium]|tara:strand:+ start:1034 stop:1279 length:246 start_codon:yes stop_codon:yes gene_type:complete
MLHKIAFLLLVVGGLNWLLLGVFGWEIGSLFGGMDAVISRVIYVLVGLSALVELFIHKRNCGQCAGGGRSAPTAGGMNPGM